MTDQQIIIDGGNVILKAVFKENRVRDNVNEFIFHIFSDDTTVTKPCVFSLTEEQCKTLSEFLLTKQMDNTL